jgi:hypothetical protein
MKLTKFLKYISLGVSAAFFVVSCADEDTGPVLPDSSTFTAPVLSNEASKASVELLPENASTVFEKFEWQPANYGVNVSTDYILEVDDNEDFSSAQTLIQTSATSAEISVEDFNDAMLALGLPGFEESTVFVRVRSTITGLETDEDRGIINEPLISSALTRIATTYQSSECGNFCSIGIIGSASPGGWDVDTDLRIADPADKFTWSTILYLNSGEVKFRASDAWDVNWGANSFPDGTGTQNGANIPVANAGYYKVVFNDNTGAYTFTAVPAPLYITIGVIGSGTAGGWDSDTDLVPDALNPHIWTGVITFTDGEAKFRAENDWAANWGGATYPSGVGVGNGPNIPVKAGTYAVRFNDATGEYFIMPQATATPFDKIGIIGSATPGGWDADTDLIKNPSNPFLWSKTITLTDAEAKFRADDAWDVNWGSTTFPGGIGLANGANIPVKGGTYFVTFNSGTGEYYFLK